MFKKKFPHYKQINANDCGATCLRMIASYYGKDFMPETLRQYCSTSKTGSSMLDISEAAEHIGMRNLGMRLTLKQLTTDVHFPCILHWNQNHFVVCYDVCYQQKTGTHHFYIADPASQCSIYKEEELKRSWLHGTLNGQPCGIALLLEPNENFGRQEKPLSLHKKEKSIRIFIKYCTPHKKMLLKTIVWLFAGMGIQFTFPFLTQTMVDIGIKNSNLEIISLILLAQFLLFSTQLLIEFIRSRILLRINAHINIALISNFLFKLTCLPLYFFETRKLGDTLLRINDHERIKNILVGSNLNIISSLFTFLVFAITLAYYNWLLFIIFIAGNICYMIWTLAFMNYRRGIDYKRFEISSTTQVRLIQLIQGMQEIKLNNCERQKRWEWEELQTKLFHIDLKGLTIEQIQQTGSLFFTQSTNMLIIYLAARAVVQGNISIGMMMSISYIVGQLAAPISNFIQYIHTLQDAQISIERLNDIYAQEDEEQHIEDKTTSIPNTHNISIKGVYYSYTENCRNYILKNINLEIPQGKITAIVGGSGSGKTTLLKILQGFYAPNKGEIYVGNMPLKDINPHVWRSITGSVMQENFIFSDTIARNIALSSEEIDSERLYNAAKMANVDTFVAEMPLGYNTRIGAEGNGISQGQRQRILIARAIYKDPEYMFFDEATNALDAMNEWSIMNTLAHFYQGKTVVIAAHRLSTIRNADQIIVMKDGRIVERGSHEQLLSLKGEYHRLTTHQIEEM